MAVERRAVERVPEAAAMDAVAPTKRQPRVVRVTCELRRINLVILRRVIACGRGVDRRRRCIAVHRGLIGANNAFDFADNSGQNGTLALATGAPGRVRSQRVKIAREDNA